MPLDVESLTSGISIPPVDFGSAGVAASVSLGISIVPGGSLVGCSVGVVNGGGVTVWLASFSLPQPRAKTTSKPIVTPRYRKGVKIKLWESAIGLSLAWYRFWQSSFDSRDCIARVAKSVKRLEKRTEVAEKWIGSSWRRARLRLVFLEAKPTTLDFLGSDKMVDGDHPLVFTG